ncbi:hypothetical protein ACOCJ7_16055 [Knoellia sp. CPCC 206453]|uniref:hypothetical protein n=1 Tax=Knoellia pratensis TaxID=3404796 RepID=UPI003613CD5C
MFILTRDSELTPAELWLRASALAEHTATVPLTTTIADPGSPTVGWGFVVRTALGPFHFDDSMVVETWEPPRQWRIRKTGRLSGWAELVVTPYAAGSRVTWTEELWLGSGGVRRLTSAMGDLLGPRLFGRVVDRFAAVAP